MKTFEELANAVVDGVATPEERTALDSLLERDPTARERFHTMMLAVRALGHLREVEVPDDLKDQVMSEVRAQSPPWAAARRSTRARGPSLADFISRAMGLRLAAAFAAGIASGAIAFSLVSGGRPLSGNFAVGTMAPPVVEPQGMSLAAGSARASIEVVPAGDVVNVRIAKHVTDSTTVEITWPAEGGIRARLRSGDRIEEGLLAVPPSAHK